MHIRSFIVQIGMIYVCGGATSPECENELPNYRLDHDTADCRFCVFTSDEKNLFRNNFSLWGIKWWIKCVGPQRTVNIVLLRECVDHWLFGSFFFPV